MKKAKRFLTVALAALTVASTAAIGTASVSAASLKAPKISVSNSEKSVKITWKKVSGAKSYKVYRGSKLIKKTSKLVAKDFSAKAGKTYTYKVKAVNGKKTSKASAGVKITRINRTVFKELVNKAKSVKVLWNKRKGANQYKVYRATSGSFKLVYTTTKTSYTDKDVVSGKTYTYKVRCLNTKTKSKSMYSTAKSITHLTQVTDVKARENADTKSVSVTWTATKAAESYDVYRLKAGDSSYVKVANVTGTSYKDEDMSKNPTVYAYKVFAVKDSTKSYESSIRYAPYAPKEEGVDRFQYFATNRVLHILINLDKGEQYKEGKALADILSVQDLYTATSSDEAVATVNDGVITAVGEGEATVTLKVTDAAAEIVEKLENVGLAKVAAKTIYIEVVVK